MALTTRVPSPLSPTPAPTDVDELLLRLMPIGRPQGSPLHFRVASCLAPLVRVCEGRCVACEMILDLLPSFRGLAFFQVTGEQDGISVRVLDYRKIHPEGGFVGSEVALVAVTREFGVLCIHGVPRFQVELKDRAVVV
jgi:hypothetical protein